MESPSRQGKNIQCDGPKVLLKLRCYGDVGEVLWSMERRKRLERDAQHVLRESLFRSSRKRQNGKRGDFYQVTEYFSQARGAVPFNHPRQVHNTVAF